MRRRELSGLPGSIVFDSEIVDHLSEHWRKITLDEIATLSALNEDGCWMVPTLAANTVYKMFSSRGRDSTGIAGF